MASADRERTGEGGAPLSVTDPQSTTFAPPAAAPRLPGAPVPAGWWRRVGATILDNLIIGIPLTIVLLAAGADDTLEGTAVRAIFGVIFLVYAALMLAYHRGQTLGKQATGVRILTEDGGQIGLGQALGREALKAVFGVTVIVYLLDVLWPLWQPENRALHDLVAGTRPVRAGTRGRRGAGRLRPRA
jgi:uncharacterized RDD family membrane protein YckC